MVTRIYQMEEQSGDLAEFVKKNETQIMIFLPHYTWAQNNKPGRFGLSRRPLKVQKEQSP